MKTFKLISIFIFSTFFGNAQCTWISFTDENPSKPIINLYTSSIQQVKYNVVIPGIYSEIINNGEAFQRLSISGGSTCGQPGYPEIPDVSKLIAIPECSGYSISVEPKDSVVVYDINLYPVPLMVKDSSGMHEQFYKNDSIYSMDSFFPVTKFETKDGYLRSQRILSFFGYAFKYNPQQKTLVIYNNYNVIIDFHNPTTDVNVDNGLFNIITKNTLLNFNSNNTPSIPNNAPPPVGPVTWKTLNSCADADQLVADYLIITYDSFFNPHSLALQKFADHKATLNGFNVAIVNVPNILSLPWSIDSDSINYNAERKIREFIRRVFTGGHALNTYDGKLAFVCLVGDTQDDVFETYVPVSFDPDPTGYFGYLAYNDYYYSCVTKNSNNQWDLLGDLFIGRICVRTETELDNYVTKLKHNENEFTYQPWRGNTILVYGGNFNSGTPIAEHSFWTTDLKNYLDNILPLTFHTEIIDATTLNTQWNITYKDYLNNEGANVVIHHGHGLQSEWTYQYAGYSPYALSTDYKRSNLNNTDKYPIALSNSCLTGAFVGPLAGGMGEILTTYSPTAGYVGYVGAPIEVVTYQYNLPFDQNQNFFTHFLTALYSNQSHVMGEAILEARAIGVNLGATNTDYTNFKYNLFGDPAYNCMTPGYEITQNLILPPAPPAPQTIMISNPVYIRSGARLTLSNNAVLEFGKDGQLIVDDGGSLVMSSNVTIKGMNSVNKIIVNGLLTGPMGSYANPTPINGLTLSPIPVPGCTWGGIEFNNPNLTVKIHGGTISNCSLSGSLYKLESLYNTTFSTSSIILTNSNLSLATAIATGTNVSISNPQANSALVEILSSTFTNSSADGVISFDHVTNYKIQNCSVTYDHGIGIDLHYSGWNGSNYQIDQNSILKSGNPQDNSWGIKVYRSKVDITKNHVSNNRYGISCLNASQTKIMGNSAAATLNATQQISNNYQNQIRIYDNSFPWYVHYNELKNNLLSNSFLIYYNNSNILPEGGYATDYLFNVKCNCFDNSTPNPQLYPVGSYQYNFTWCASGYCDAGQPVDILFDQAVAAMDSGNYSGADSMFRTIIETSPGSDMARESAKNLIPVTENLTMDFSALKSYYLETPGLHSDSLTDHLVYRLMNTCDLSAENYNNAIAWFEDDILHPASVEDSIYSLIDLCDTYMIMEADSGLKSVPNNIHGKLTQYIPKNHQEYVLNRQKWISLLFKDDALTPGGTEISLTKEYELSQNNPNPFTTTTEISFTTPKDGTVLITVTNMIGQTIHTESRQFVSGNNIVSLNLSNSADGIYFVSFIFDNQSTKKMKIIKQK